jgi:hypothetical protein
MTAQDSKKIASGRLGAVHSGSPRRSDLIARWLPSSLRNLQKLGATGPSERRLDAIEAPRTELLETWSPTWFASIRFSNLQAPLWVAEDGLVIMALSFD